MTMGLGKSVIRDTVDHDLDMDRAPIAKYSRGTSIASWVSSVHRKRSFVLGISLAVIIE